MQKAENRFQSLIDNLKSTNIEEKLLSIAALGILGIKEHSVYLTDLLSSSDERITTEAIKALGKIANPTSVKYLADFVAKDVDTLANAAFEAINGIDLTDALDAVIAPCTLDAPPKIRARLIKLLAKYNDVRAASLANEVLGQTKDAELLVEAIGYFCKFPSPDRRTSLQMLASSDNWQVSLMANLALSRLGDGGAYAQIRRLVKSSNAEVRQIIAQILSGYPKIEDRSIFQLLFEDSRAKIREIALEGLNMFASDERFSILHSWLCKETDSGLRAKLLERAKAENSPLYYDIFYKFLQSPDDKIKNIALEAIEQMGQTVADRLIIDFGRMPLVVKEQIILVLGKIGGEKPIKIIKKCLASKERWLAINAIEACAYLDNDELNDELLKMVRNKNTDIWVEATVVGVLGRLGNIEFANDVSPLLCHEDARVRANAIDALAALEWPSLGTECNRLLHDKNDRVRVNAAIALWRLGRQEVFNELEKMSHNKSRWVRASAAFALGKITDKHCTPILLKMLLDSEDMVYRNAYEALAAQGDLRALLPMLIQSKTGRMSQDFYNRSLLKFSKEIHKTL